MTGFHRWAAKQGSTASFGSGSARVTRRSWKRSVVTGVWIEPCLEPRYSDSWCLPSWGRARASGLTAESGDAPLPGGVSAQFFATPIWS